MKHETCSGKTFSDCDPSGSVISVCDNVWQQLPAECSANKEENKWASKLLSISSESVDEKQMSANVKERTVAAASLCPICGKWWGGLVCIVALSTSQWQRQAAVGSSNSSSSNIYRDETSITVFAFVNWLRLNTIQVKGNKEKTISRHEDMGSTAYNMLILRQCQMSAHVICHLVGGTTRCATSLVCRLANICHLHFRPGWTTKQLHRGHRIDWFTCSAAIYRSLGYEFSSVKLWNVLWLKICDSFLRSLRNRWW